MCLKHDLQTSDTCERKVNVLSQISHQILSRFCRVCIDIKKVNRKHKERLAPLSLVADEEEFSLFGFDFSLFINIYDCTDAKHVFKPFSAAAQSFEAKDTYGSVTRTGFVNRNWVRNKDTRVL